MPGFQRLTDFQCHALKLHLAAEGKAELGLGLEPDRAQRQAVLVQVAQHIQKILPDEGRHHETVVQRRAPARQAARNRVFPTPRDDGAQQQLLGKAHPRVWRHLKSAKLDKAEAAGRPIGREQLVDTDFRAVGVAGHVDQAVAQQAVNQPGRRNRGIGARRHDLIECYFQLIKAVMAGLVNPGGLAGRADKGAGKQIRQRRVALPEQDQAFQQVGAAQKGAVVGGNATDDNMVAAAGAGVAAICHELVSAQTTLAGLFIHRVGGRDAILPRGRGVDVDLQGDAEHFDARVMGRAVALDDDGLADGLCRRFDLGNQLQIMFQPFDRRQENAQLAVARLNGNSGAHRAVKLWRDLFCALLALGICGKAGDSLAARLFHLWRCGGAGQRAAHLRRVSFGDKGIVAFGDVGQAAQRQAVADGAVTRHQVNLAPAQLPDL